MLSVLLLFYSNGVFGCVFYLKFNFGILQNKGRVCTCFWTHLNAFLFFLDYNIARYECLGKTLSLDNFKNSRFQLVLVGSKFFVKFGSKFGSRSKNWT